MRTVRLICLFVWIGLFLQSFGDPQAVWAFGSRPPNYLMANIGDSITAGTFADTSTDLPRSVFLSITGGFAFDNFKTFLLIENKKSYSWASGEWIDSHYQKLKRLIESGSSQDSLDVMNLAVPGAVAADTLVQAQRLVDAMKSGEYKELKYITLLIGANDACSSETESGTPSEHFGKSVWSTLEKLAEIQQSERIRILVSSLPDIASLGRPEMRKHVTGGVLSCDYFRRKILGFCKPLTKWKGEQEFLEKYQVVAEKNEVLRTVVQEASRAFPQLDIVFSDSLSQYDITPEILAMDCFHPNKRGHEQMSELLWKDQPWF